jgi:hypothetical protein
MTVNTVFSTNVIVSPARMTVTEGAEMVVGKISVLKESTSRVAEKLGKEKGVGLHSGADKLDNISNDISKQMQAIAGPRATANGFYVVRP